jgi:hypothetical protein
MPRNANTGNPEIAVPVLSSAEIDSIMEGCIEAGAK